MKYILLSEGDTFTSGDEMQSPVSGIWSEVPYQWYGMKVSWSDNNTFSRFKISVRRAMDTKESLSTANNSRVTQVAESANIAEAATS